MVLHILLQFASNLPIPNIFVTGLSLHYSRLLSAINLTVKISDDGCAVTIKLADRPRTMTTTMADASRRPGADVRPSAKAATIRMAMTMVAGHRHSRTATVTSAISSVAQRRQEHRRLAPHRPNRAHNRRQAPVPGRCWACWSRSVKPLNNITAAAVLWCTWTVGDYRRSSCWQRISARNLVNQMPVCVSRVESFLIGRQQLYNSAPNNQIM